MFDPTTYFQTLTESLKLTKDKYHFCEVSGLDSLEGVISSRKKHSHFIAVDDSVNGTTIKGGGGGFFDRRPTTIFICAALSVKSSDKRKAYLDEFRIIYKSFISKLIKDRSSINSTIDVSRIPYYEMPNHFANGCVGIYFMIYDDQPTNLEFNDADWQ